MKNPTLCFVLAFPIIFFSASASVSPQIKVTDNPADKLVATVNSNRTAHKLPSLFSNQGLACIALQYIKAYEGDCDAAKGPKAKKPADSEFAKTFAPNCGVDVSTLSPITGRFLGCQSKYIPPPEAFSHVLMKDEKSLDILYSKNHTEVGGAVSGSGSGGPYFWCVLFSGGNTKSSFKVQSGEAKVTKPGCFSGANDVCSDSADWRQARRPWLYAGAGLLGLIYAFGL